MELSEKKEHILRCIKLGMAQYESMIVAKCTAFEMDSLEQDESFQAEIKLHQCIQEEGLLKKFNVAMEAQLRMGQTKALERLLSKINPERWDDRKKEDDKDNGLPTTVNINLKGVFPSASKS